MPSTPTDSELLLNFAHDVSIPLEPCTEVEPIAIIGMAIRGPGAHNVEEYWNLVCAGRDGIEKFAPSPSDPRVGNPRFVAAEGVLRDALCFDHEFFGFSSLDASLSDPQHRVFMQAAWTALENAGCDPKRYPGRIGIFGGAGAPRYWLGPVARALANETTDTLAYRAMLHNGAEMLTSRTAFKLGLNGPALTVNAACATSLAAVHLARQAILAGDCEMALAGGVSIASFAPEDQGYIAAEGGILSAKGRCRPFSVDADGTVKSNGVAMVVLKRLSAAQRDGDLIRAVILGSAMNNDGGSAIGFSAPSVDGQVRALEAAYAAAGVAPSSVSFVEAHGTGTSLGDATEVAALKRVFKGGSGIALTAAKANVGHLDAAAGAASLIKAALCLQHAILPGMPDFQAPNPLLGLSSSPFTIHSGSRRLDAHAANVPLRAGVTSIGMGGTNVHLVLQQAPPASRTFRVAQRPQLLCLSAKSEIALDSIADQIERRIADSAGLDIADVACTLARGRAELPFRRAVVIDPNTDSVAVSDHAGAVRPIAFLFPGQGAQYINMGRDLYRDFPVFRSVVDQSLDILRDDANLDLSRYLLDGDASKQPALNEAGLAQPATFVISYAMAKLLLSWGMEPSAFFGHSLGEYAAACLAGVFSLRDAVCLVAARGRLMETAGPGAMTSVLMERREIEHLIGSGVSIATEAPGCTVLSGPVDCIDAAEAVLTRHGIDYKRLAVTQAYHSAMMRPLREAFAALVAAVPLNPPAIPLLSCLTGDWLSDEEATSPDYWADHLCSTVTLQNGFAELLSDPAQAFIEVGPGKSMHGFLRRHPASTSAELLSFTTIAKADERTGNDSAFLLHSIGRLWAGGVQIDWDGFYADEPRRRVELPTYPFARHMHTIEPVRALKPEPFDLVRETAAIGAREREIESELGIRTVDDRPGLREALNSLSAAFVSRYLARHGGDIAIADLRRQLRILPKFERMFHFLLDVLRERHIVALEGERVRWLRKVSAAVEKAQFLQRFPDFAGQVRFIEHCADAYPRALSGEVESIGVLYPEGTDAFYLDCMRDSADVSSEGLYLRLGREITERVVAKNGGKARILEVGSGHGTFTWPLLEMLGKHDVEYHFTDIGRSFLARAEEEAARRGIASLRTSRLDLNADPAMQGHNPGDFDLVVGFNSVHTARDTAHTVAWLKDLLKPAGVMLLVEATRIELWEQLTWGLAPGFWDFQERSSGSLVHDESSWRALLNGAGFASAAVLPASGTRQNHAVVIGQRGAGDEAVTSPARRPVVARAKAPVPLVAPAGRELEIAGVWKRLLGVDSIHNDQNFFHLGGDSLLAVQLLAEIRVRFSVEIKISKFSQTPTIAGMLALFPSDPLDSPAPKPAATTMPECIVPLQKLGAQSPLFLVHPIGGSASCYHPLAAGLGEDRPIYGVQQISHDHTSLEIMASHYLDSIRQVQPNGPYRLAGWSFGAVVAQEIARQLEQHGEVVTAVFRIDAPPKTMECGLDRDLAASAMANRAPNAETTTQFLESTRSNRALLSAHTPGLLKAPVVEFRATQGLSGESSEAQAGVHILPGDHFSILTDETALAILIREIRAILDNPAKAEIVALAQRFLDLTADGPVGHEVVDEMFAPDCGVHLFDSYDSNFVGFQQIRQLYAEEYQAIADPRTRLYDTTVRIAPGGQAAWLAGRIDSDLTLRKVGRRISFPRTRVTWAFEKHDGQWKVSQVHFSIPVGVPLRMME